MQDFLIGDYFFFQSEQKVEPVKKKWLHLKSGDDFKRQGPLNSQWALNAAVCAPLIFFIQLGNHPDPQTAWPFTSPQAPALQDSAASRRLRQHTCGGFWTSSGHWAVFFNLCWDKLFCGRARLHDHGGLSEGQTRDWHWRSTRLLAVVAVCVRVCVCVCLCVSVCVWMSESGRKHNSIVTPVSHAHH